MPQNNVQNESFSVIINRNEAMCAWVGKRSNIQTGYGYHKNSHKYSWPIAKKRSNTKYRTKYSIVRLIVGYSILRQSVGYIASHQLLLEQALGMAKKAGGCSLGRNGR
mmetsp:Transcript_23039/g.40876  ORF Transcript_23039/g.40876 Transcript_23039/m.40876 type:complete len:108 (-) Transcript_23039:174-497(-)